MQEASLAALLRHVRARHSGLPLRVVRCQAHLTVRRDLLLHGQEMHEDGAATRGVNLVLRVPLTSIAPPLYQYGARGGGGTSDGVFDGPLAARTVNIRLKWPQIPF